MEVMHFVDVQVTILSMVFKNFMLSLIDAIKSAIVLILWFCLAKNYTFYLGTSIIEYNSVFMQLQLFSQTHVLTIVFLDLSIDE